MNDVERVIIRNEVRQSLLDSIPVEFCGKIILPLPLC